jgi:hypothetical protein
MKVAVLSENISSAVRIYKEIRKINKCTSHMLVFIKSPVYVLRQFAGMVFRLKFKDWFLVLKALLSGRIKVYFGGLKSNNNLKKITKNNYDIGLHNYSIIYTNDIINCFKRGILNSHIGILPRYRGRSVMEWSLYEKSPTGITVFYIDEGIDTGREIIIREEVSVTDCRSIKQAKEKLFSLDGVFYAKAVVSEIEGKPHQINDGSGPRFYVMSKTLLEFVERENFA